MPKRQIKKSVRLILEPVGSGRAFSAKAISKKSGTLKSTHLRQGSGGQALLRQDSHLRQDFGGQAGRVRKNTAQKAKPVISLAVKRVSKINLARPMILPTAPRPVYARANNISRIFKKVGKFALLSKLSLILLLVVSVFPLSAFEAHVVNVTAKIERQQCTKYTVQNLNYWKQHSEFWVLPETIGSLTVTTSTDTMMVLNSSGTMYKKLQRQLLTLKFNLEHFGIENALVPGESTRIADLVDQADALLNQEPAATNTDLELMKNRVESVNNAGEVSTCQICPDGMAMLTSYSYFVNSTTTLDRLRGNINPGDHVKVNFTLAEGCENVGLSLVSYQMSRSDSDERGPNKQKVFDSATGDFSAGPNSMEINVPACNFSIDFVKGSVIERFDSDNSYSPQGRLIDEDRGDPGAPKCDFGGRKAGKDGEEEDNSEGDDSQDSNFGGQIQSANIFDSAKSLITTLVDSFTTTTATSTDSSSTTLESTSTGDGDGDSTSIIPEATSRTSSDMENATSDKGDGTSDPPSSVDSGGAGMGNGESDTEPGDASVQTPPVNDTAQDSTGGAGDSSQTPPADSSSAPTPPADSSSVPQS